MRKLDRYSGKSGFASPEMKDPLLTEKSKGDYVSLEKCGLHQSVDRIARSIQPLQATFESFPHYTTNRQPDVERSIPIPSPRNGL